MIHEFLRAELNKIPALKDAVYPVSVNLDGIEGTVAVYSYQKSTPVYNIGGDIHRYEDTINIDLIGSLYDDLCQLSFDILDRLAGVDFDDEMGDYIFSLTIDVPERDVFDPEVMLYRKSLRAEVTWAPVDWEGD